MQKNKVGLAAEFAVGSELCRRNVYAQPTLGHQKRTDLLIFSEDDELLRIEVKGKQGPDWPNCKGIYGSNVILVFVDFKGKSELERPDFYILTERDWFALVQREVEMFRSKGKRVELDEYNVPIFINEVNTQGQAYRGMGVTPAQIQQHKEKWEKITQAVLKKSHRS